MNVPLGRVAAPVLVIGAGLAGLACAADLAAAGVRVSVLESGEEPGGRMRTDVRGGFRLDRGFQVFNTSYPQVKRRLPLRRLGLRPFTPGALVHTPTGRIRFADPTRSPETAVRLLTAGHVSPVGAASLGALSARDMLLPPALLRRMPDTSTAAALRSWGMPEELVEQFMRPFLSGVFLEDGLVTSSRVFHLVWRSFLRGTLTLPAEGIGAVPRRLARTSRTAAWSWAPPWAPSSTGEYGWPTARSGRRPPSWWPPTPSRPRPCCRAARPYRPVR